MIGDNLRSEKARQLQLAVTVRGAHHRDLDPLIAESGHSPGPLPLDHAAAHEFEAEFAKEGDRPLEVVDDDADVVHASESHRPNVPFVTCRDQFRSATVAKWRA